MNEALVLSARYNGPYQNVTGSDGIGDKPYILETNNMDNYPLTKPYPWTAHNVGVMSVETSKSVVRQRFSMSANVMMFNYGNDTETDNVTICANQTVISEIYGIELTSRNFTVIPLKWNTTGFAMGNCTRALECFTSLYFRLTHLIRALKSTLF